MPNKTLNGNLAQGYDLSTSMTQKILKNKAASNREKLLNIARAQKINFDALLLRFMQERLLYRLSVSKYKARIVLKGGLLLTCYDLPFLRATRDMDFLAKQIDQRPELMKDMFKDILKQPCADGVSFDLAALAVDNIKKGSDSVGIRIKIKASLEQATKILQIDIGFGDIIIPRPLTMTFPTLLDEVAPKIGVYSKESIIAEKFEAMIKLSIINSRLKDFYDIYALATAYPFEASVLKAAIRATFKRRKTVLTAQPILFESSFFEDSYRQKQWLAFLRKSKLDLKIDFGEVMAKLTKFLRPVVLDITSKAKRPRSWDPKQELWQEH